MEEINIEEGVAGRSVLVKIEEGCGGGGEGKAGGTLIV